MINSKLIKFAPLINVVSIFPLDGICEFNLENGLYLYVPAKAKEFIHDVRLDLRIFLNEYKNPDWYTVTSANQRIRLKVEICPD